MTSENRNHPLVKTIHKYLQATEQMELEVKTRRHPHLNKNVKFSLNNNMEAHWQTADWHAALQFQADLFEHGITVGIFKKPNAFDLVINHNQPGLMENVAVLDAKLSQAADKSI